VADRTPEEIEEMARELAAIKGKHEELLGETKAAKEARRVAEARAGELEQTLKAHKAGVTSQELERLRAEVRADLDKQYAPTLDEAKALQAENRRLKLDDKVKGAMAKSGARADRIDALYKLTQGEYDLTDDGQPMLKTRPGTPVEKFVAEDLKGMYPEFYEGSGSSGGGASRSVAGGAGSQKVIAADDGAAFLANLEGIAKGTVAVR
jgi:hypothetical protein